MSLKDQVLTAEVVQVPLNAIFAMQQSKTRADEIAHGLHILAEECGTNPYGICGRSHQCSVGLKATKKS